MAERLIAPVLKTGGGVNPSSVGSNPTVSLTQLALGRLSRSRRVFERSRTHEITASLRSDAAGGVAEW